MQSTNKTVISRPDPKVVTPRLLLPSGITEGIPVLVESRWTPEQAVAVIELLDDLREQIMQHYAPQIQAHFRDDRAQNAGAPPNHPEIDNEPF